MINRQKSALVADFVQYNELEALMIGDFRIGIMGTGAIASTMAKTIKGTKGVTNYAVGSRDISRAQAFAKDNGVKKAYGSYEELVNDPKVNLIYVATPHSEHFDNVKLAISAGKPVLCEKAFMLNEQQASMIFKYADEKGVFVSEAMWTRFMPLRTKLDEILASHVIGDPTMLTANLSYNIAWKQRIQDPSLGGGALLDLGVYCLNFASMVFGNDVSDISSICTYNANGMDMQDSITLRYPTGQMAVLNASANSASDRRGVIYGTKGYIVVDNINNYESITVYDADHNKIGFYKRPKQVTGYEYEVISSVKAIKEGWKECPEMPHSESLKIMNMMDFIRKNLGISFPGEPKSSFENIGKSNNNDVTSSDASTDPAETVSEATQEETQERQTENEQTQ